MVSLNYRRHFPAVSLFIFCISLTYCNSQLIGTEGFVQRQPKPLSKLEDLPLKYPMSSVEILESLNVILKNLSSSSLPTITFTTNVSQQCIEDSYFYLEHLMLNATDWAVQMFESSAQLPAGLIGYGNYHAEGLFDECLAVVAPKRFHGRYCTVFFRPEPVDWSTNNPSIDYDHNTTTPMSFILQKLFGSALDVARIEPKLSSPDAMTYAFPSLSLCLPSSCSASDIGQSFAQLIGSYIIANQSMVTIADNDYCFTEDNEPSTFDGPTIAFMVTFSLIGFAVLLGTAHDSWRTFHAIDFNDKTDTRTVRFFHCFSVLTNGRKLLSLEPLTTNNLSCLHGIRFLSTCWVVMGHTWLKSSTANFSNPKMVVEEAMTWPMESIINASVSVDSFFLMSGLLVSYLLLQELDRNKGKLNLGLMYIHRYLRLTPVYAVILGFIATLMVYLGTGPYWYNVTVASEGCGITWWKQFLYINNLFPTDMNCLCMGETWYLAVDMQLFIISPLLIYPIWRWRKAGHILLAVFTLATLAANVAVFAVYNFPPSVMPTRMVEMMTTAPSYMDNYYFKPWTRATPYLIGIWVGWLLNRVNKSKFQMPSWLVVVLWALSAGMGALVIYGLTPYLNESKIPEIEGIVKLTYGPFHRTGWALALSWVIVACTNGYGGIVDRFLSWRGFLPLSRLTYCVYLIHYDYLNVFYSLNRKILYYTFIEQFTTFLGIVVAVFGLSFLVSVCVEAPFINLERLVLTSSKRSAEKEGETRDDIEQNRTEGNLNAGFVTEPITNDGEPAAK